MSCTVVAVPFALYWVIETVVPVAAVATASFAAAYSNKDSLNNDLNQTEQYINENLLPSEHFIEKTFETPFMDKNILLKTLEEHGVKDIVEWENGLSGEVDNYKLIFEKEAEDRPYNVKIHCLEQDNAEEKAGDLNSEYALNVQEDAYLHIINKLKENNMQIEEEEVMEDNTIVLTINID